MESAGEEGQVRTYKAWPEILKDELKSMLSLANCDLDGVDILQEKLVYLHVAKHTSGRRSWRRSQEKIELLQTNRWARG
jgi:hypothetical protein